MPLTDEVPTRPAWRVWLALLGILITLAVGFFLIIVPWQDEWSFNAIQEVSPSMEIIWEDPAFRGSLSGLGVANVLIAFLELLRILRRSP